MIELWAVGGYQHVGCKNMTAIKIDDEVVILDAGFNMDVVSNYSGEDSISSLSEKQMRAIDAIPDDSQLKKEWGKYVKAIIISHAHLDHTGAVKYIAPKYNAPIISTPFTYEVIQNLLEGKKIPNKFIRMNPGNKMRISDNIELEFINITHSTPQTVIIALHTKYGTIVYANDWKFDNYPILGKRPNYKRLKSLKNVVLLITDMTRVNEAGRTLSEHIAREMLRDVLLWGNTEGKAVVLTTFASHIARIDTMIKIAKQMNRVPILLGRSMDAYMKAAVRSHVYRLPKGVKVYGFKKQIQKVLKSVEANRGKYVLIVTGNQGEPESVLTRMVNDEFPFRFRADDYVVFSSSTIPSPTNIARREEIETRLMAKGAKLFKDIHVSGHASREDHRELISMLKPKHYVPTHGDMERLALGAKLAMEMGYELGKTVHIFQEGTHRVLEA